MKKRHNFATTAALALSLALPAAAQQMATPPNPPNASSSPGSMASGPDAFRSVAYKNLEKADKIIGMNVTDPQERKLGAVKELAIDLKSGRIAEVIVGTGGIAGLDEKMVAVPPQAFTFADLGKELRLNEADSFRAAPVFKLSDWDFSTSGERLTAAYQRFHQTPPTDLTPGYLDLERAGKIMGLTAKNQQRDRLGKVENLVVDLSGGRVVEVILASGGFLGIKDELSAIPPEAFTYVMGTGALTLDTTKEALRNAPHFKPADWRSSVNDDVALTGVYKAYNVPPYFTPGSTDTTVQNAVPNSVTIPANTADTQSDMNITARVAQLIRATDGLSADAKAVQVTTLRGRVTLRGMADSDKEKKQLGELAATVVASQQVDNQIIVKTIGTTSSLN